MTFTDGLLVWLDERVLRALNDEIAQIETSIPEKMRKSDKVRVQLKSLKSAGKCGMEYHEMSNEERAAEVARLNKETNELVRAEIAANKHYEDLAKQRRDVKARLAKRCHDLTEKTVSI